MTTFQYNDGGRAAAGYKGNARDCVVRAIAIATGQEYQDVYDSLFTMNRAYLSDEPGLVRMGKKASPRNAGTTKRVIRLYLEGHGWKWKPTMGIGTGCNVHLKAEELPKGWLICSVSKHLVAVKDGVIHDIFDCSRNGTRCVYGYFYKPI